MLQILLSCARFRHAIHSGELHPVTLNVASLLQGMDFFSITLTHIFRDAGSTFAPSFGDMSELRDSQSLHFFWPCELQPSFRRGVQVPWETMCWRKGTCLVARVQIYRKGGGTPSHIPCSSSYYSGSEASNDSCSQYFLHQTVGVQNPKLCSKTWKYLVNSMQTTELQLQGTILVAIKS